MVGNLFDIGEFLTDESNVGLHTAHLFSIMEFDDELST